MGVDPDHLPDGTELLGGELVIESRLGRGGGATVYAARKSDGTNVALKILASRHADDVEMRMRFENEAKIAASLSDLPFIVKVHGLHPVPELGGRWSMVQDLVLGPTLSGRLRSGALPPRIACDIIRDVADALAHLHARGVIHRDIKSSNIMCARGDAFERTMILDFGVAYSLRLAGSPATAASKRSDQRPGTKEYMAPEQALGMTPTPLVDLYALAVTLFEAVLGDIPYFGHTAHEIVLRKCNSDLPSFSLANEGTDLPAALVRLVDEGLQREPERRIASAAIFRDRLDEILAEFDVPRTRVRSTEPDRLVELRAVRGRTEPTPERDHLAVAGTIDGGAESGLHTEDAEAAKEARAREVTNRLEGADTIEPASSPTAHVTLVPDLAATVDVPANAPGLHGVRPPSVIVVEPDAPPETPPRGRTERTRRSDREARGDREQASGESWSREPPPPLVAQTPGAGGRRRGVIAVVSVVGVAGLGWAIATQWPQTNEFRSTDESVRPSAVTVPSNASRSIDPLPTRMPIAHTSTPAVPDGPPIPPPPTETVASPHDGGTTKPRERPMTPRRVRTEPAPHESTRCIELRTAANEAFGRFDWAAVLTHSADRGCWPSRTAWERLRVLAFSEAKQYTNCIAVGAKSRDPNVQRLVDLCRTRGGS